MKSEETNTVEETGCGFKCARDEMQFHEDECDHVSIQCEKCKDLVARKDTQNHDCVQSMLRQYTHASENLSELSKKVDEITGDI